MASESADSELDAALEEFLKEPFSSEGEISAKMDAKYEPQAAVETDTQGSSESGGNLLMTDDGDATELSLSTPAATGLYSTDFDDEGDATMKDPVGEYESFQTVILKEGEDGKSVGIESKPEPVASVQELASRPATRTVDEIMMEVDVLERRSRMGEELAMKAKTGESHLREAPVEPPSQLREERRRYEKLRAEFAAQERDVKKDLDELRSAYEEKLFKLHEENIFLSSKLAESGGGKPARDPDEDAAEFSAKVQLELALKSMKEREKLMVGYQSENERLYEDSKRMSARLKEREKHWAERYEELESQLTKMKLKDGLAEKDREITELRERLSALDREKGRCQGPGDSARVILLEKRVEELKELVVTKHPDSVSALILAANLVDEESESVAELKAGYETRLTDLENALKEAEARNPSHRRHASLSALERELEGCRERHRKEVEELKSQLSALRPERAVRSRGSPSKVKERDAFEESRKLEQRVRTLEKRLEEAETANARISKAREDDEALMESLRDAQRVELRELEMELGRWFATAADRKTQLDALRNENSKTTDEVARLKMEVGKLEDANGSLKRKLRDAAETAENYRERAEDLRARLRDLRDGEPRRWDGDREISSWKAELRDKKKEVDGFRRELDSILNALEEMRRLGVRVPVTDTVAPFLK